MSTVGLPPDSDVSDQLAAARDRYFRGWLGRLGVPKRRRSIRLAL